MRLEVESKGYQPRRGGLILVQILVALLFCIFIIRFWYLQVLSGEELARLAHNNRIRLERIFATRGLIVDDKGRLLAENRPAFCIAINREDCPDINATLAQISKWMNVPYQSIVNSYKKEVDIAKPFDPLVLATDISFELLSEIENDLRLWPGVQIVIRQRRHYPQGELFAHIIGYMNKPNREELEGDKDLSPGDTVGKTGLEFALEKTAVATHKLNGIKGMQELRGIKGMQEVEVDVKGRQLNKMTTKTPIGGDIVRLSLDIDIQKAAFDALGDYSGSVVVMDPDTGKLKALVSKPSYDNNTIQERKTWALVAQDPRHPLFHRALQSTYPPGSVWKLLMAALLLKEGVDPKQTVFCSGETKLGNHTFRCWKKGGHGSVNMLSSLVNSCDVYYYEMGKKMGIDRISAYAKENGFGQPTGIELNREASGLMPSREWKKKKYNADWQGGETLNVSIGQGSVMTTPLQMANFVSSLFNGGRILRPSVLADTPPFEKKLLDIKPEHLAIILESMRMTVESGTARVLKRSDAVIGGKTGTAQVVKIGEVRLKTHQLAYEHRDHAWIVSWGEKEGKRYVVIAMVEHGGGGGAVAGPIVKRVYDYLFGEYMNMQNKEEPVLETALKKNEETL
ncbi:penicillin-binding protein 2 [Desulfovibrio litoralis]|uniref:Peptidoglycan glycosyltransferase n=1 Tax=Desulfovibrio litoralis DSM 11393 TaxID=1121455 RepID=A0A1M7S7R5_9BACT|nr:penicillin-binding protein 2 [Desulfovibrio litoralis]SHN54667.1 peptidoglycan glycosyltransferase [Desulfovibrio litoralis DSM 11393]